MSISVTVSNPSNKEQQSVNIPVATEAVFRNFWEVGSSELGLNWVPLFEVGIEVTKEDAGEVIAELRELESWAKKTLLNQQEVIQIQDRIKRMIEEIPKIISTGNSVFIG